MSTLINLGVPKKRTVLRDASKDLTWKWKPTIRPPVGKLLRDISRKLHLEMPLNTDITNRNVAPGGINPNTPFINGTVDPSINLSHCEQLTPKRLQINGEDRGDTTGCKIHRVSNWLSSNLEDDCYLSAEEEEAALKTKKEKQAKLKSLKSRKRAKSLKFNSITLSGSDIAPEAESDPEQITKSST